MYTPNLKSVAVAIPERWTKFQNLKVGQCDLDYVHFWSTFVLLIFRSLQSICKINLNPVALAIREIFTGVCKFKSRSPKLGHVFFYIAFCTLQSKLLLVVDEHTKFDISSFSRSRDIRVRILRILASFAMSDSTLSGFWQFRSFSGATEYHLVKSERNLSTCAAELERCNRFSNCRTVGAPIGQMDLRVGGLSCTGSATDESQTLLFCHIFLNQSAGNASGPKNGTKVRTFWPPVKNWGELVGISIRIIRATHRFLAPVYFLPGGDRRSGHTLAGFG